MPLIRPAASNVIPWIASQEGLGQTIAGRPNSYCFPEVGPYLDPRLSAGHEPPHPRRAAGGSSAVFVDHDVPGGKKSNGLRAHVPTTHPKLPW